MTCKSCQGLGTVYDSSRNGQVPCPECTYCGHCDGTGRENGRYAEPCTVCGGTGDKQQIEMVDCKECEGTGEVEYNGVVAWCENCNGIGKTYGLDEWEKKQMEIGAQKVICATTEDLSKTPAYYLVELEGVYKGEKVKVLIECDALAYALGFNKNAYLYQAFTYLFRVFNKGEEIHNILKAIHFLTMWVTHKKGEK